MKNIKISVIVPVYNVEKYLCRCLKSLVNQTLRDIEIICINDGSTDNSEKILQQFAQKDARIKIFTQKNSGISIARNFGIGIAKGEYLAFVDSDDWVDKSFFEKLYNSASKNDADIACAGFKRCGKFKSSIRKCFKKEIVYTEIEDKISALNVPEYSYVTHNIYKRDKWIFNFPEGRNFEDLATILKILYFSDKIVTVPKIYYNYYRTPGSIVTQKNAKNKADYMWARSELFSFAKEKGIKICEKKGFNKKDVFKLYGLTILKIYYYENVIKYKLFGFIPFLNKFEC